MSEPSIKELNSMAQQWLVEPQASVIPGAPLIPEPGPSWLSKLAQPWADFGTSLSKAAVSTYDDLPARLFDWGMDKLGGSTKRTVQQGAGVTTTYVQPAQPGGAPAAPNYTVIQPGTQPGGIVTAPAAAGLSTFALVGIGLAIYLAVKK